MYNPSTQRLLLRTLGRDLLDSSLARHNVLDRRQNGRPVFEDGKGNFLPHTVSNEI